MQLDMVYCGDSRSLSVIDDESVNLIMTSPPYSDLRSHTYGGVKPDEYVEWFMQFSPELKRVLRNDGSFVLNINDKVVGGERHTYVIELILALREDGWKWIERYPWVKMNATPGRFRYRLRDAFEYNLHFTKTFDFKIYKDHVKIPAQESTIRKKKLWDRKCPLFRRVSGTKSGIGVNSSQMAKDGLVEPCNTLVMPTQCGNTLHSAAFPVELPTFFILLFTKKGDIVLDPFIGSGTTAIAAKKVDRYFIGVDKDREMCNNAWSRIFEEERCGSFRFVRSPFSRNPKINGTYSFGGHKK